MSEWLHSGGSTVEMEVFKVGDHVMDPSYAYDPDHGKIKAFAGEYALVKISCATERWIKLKNLKKVHKRPVLRRA